MNRRTILVVRATLAFLGLCVTGIYWMSAHSVIVDRRMCFYCEDSHWMLLKEIALLCVATLIYGFGIAIWRNFDDRLRSKANFKY